jgi:hypothetical protein
MEKTVQIMKRRLIRFMNTDSLKFAIRREQLGNGEVRLTPVVKPSGLFTQWTPIVKVNDRYEATHFETSYKYTEEDCFQYLHRYQEQLKNAQVNVVTKISYEVL